MDKYINYGFSATPFIKSLHLNKMLPTITSHMAVHKINTALQISAFCTET